MQRLAAQTNETRQSLGAFLDSCNSPEMRSLVTEAVTADRRIPNPEKLLKGDPMLTDKRGVLEQLRDEFIDRQFTIVTNKLDQSETFAGEHIALIKQRDDLRRQKSIKFFAPDEL